MSNEHTQSSDSVLLSYIVPTGRYIAELLFMVSIILFIYVCLWVLLTYGLHKNVGGWLLAAFFASILGQIVSDEMRSVVQLECVTSGIVVSTGLTRRTRRIPWDNVQKLKKGLWFELKGGMVLKTRPEGVLWLNLFPEDVLNSLALVIRKTSDAHVAGFEPVDGRF
jgi:hypothetical protein